MTDGSLVWARVREDIAATVLVLRAVGPTLGRPYVDTLKDSTYANMKELRVASGNSVVRIAFAFDPDRAAILLLGGEKQGVNERRFYKQLIARADALYARHLADLNRKKRK